MQDRPTIVELLEAVQRFLETDAIPALEGTKQFHARVAANVLAIVTRELALGRDHRDREWRRLDALLGAEIRPAGDDAEIQALRARTEQLCQRIRAGDADHEPFRRAVLDHVRETVAEKLAIDNPKLLARSMGR